ncbi:hypothetical protein N8865_00730 [Francisellaceae bacterium]|nr:hypothetical protein [Francisellaceae bacterium]
MARNSYNSFFKCSWGILLFAIIFCVPSVLYAHNQWDSYHKHDDKGGSKGNNKYFIDNSGHGKKGKPKKEKSPKKYIHDLSLHQKIVITSQDITNARAFGKPVEKDLGTFCAKTDKKDRHIKVTVSTGQGDFKLKGTRGLKDVPYNLSLNSQSVRYGKKLNFKALGDNSPYSCSYPEHIKMKIDAGQLKNIKAGAYDLSLYLQSDK